MSNITLTASMRSNLLSLRSIGVQMDKTQQRLSSGLKVNSAIDNASSYYQSRALTNRAADLNALLDSMGQAVSTIKAATTGLEQGVSILEQAAAFAVKTLSSVSIVDVKPGSDTAIASILSSGSVASSNYDSGIAMASVLSLDDVTSDVSSKSLAEYEAEGYGVVTNGMSASDISSLLATKGKIVLAENIENLTESIEITTSNAIIEGNGYKMIFTPTEEKQAAILADGEGRSVTITNLSMDVTGDKAYGIRVANGGKITIDNIMGIKVSGTGAQRAVNGDADLFDGQTNTETIINTDTSIGLGSTASAANAANQFYAPVKDADGNIVVGALADNDDFGVGTWYLPSIGEWMELRGYSAEDVSGTGKTGVVDYADSDMKKVNTTLSKMGSDAAVFNTGRAYWSSSELSDGKAWGFGYESGNRISSNKSNYFSVRCFNQVENCFDPLDDNKIEPEIGDIMYVDADGNKSWGKYDTYNTDKLSKTAVGVVCDVNSSDGSVKIINLKDLRFDTSNYTINTADPYNTKGTVDYASFNRLNSNVGGLEEIPDSSSDGTDIGARVQSGGTLDIRNNAFGEGVEGSGGGEEPGGGTVSIGSVAQYAEIIRQYDNLIKDVSYSGVNLLQNGKLTVAFNEDRSSKFVVSGKDVSSANLGLTTFDWQTTEDVVNAIKELTMAMNKIRSYSAELGNSYSIIQTREGFTDRLIDILEIGSDMLVLADMNEESANYLALQIRQQLAVNSLSLAAQSAQSVLSLF